MQMIQSKRNGLDLLAADIGVEVEHEPGTTKTTVGLNAALL